MHATQEMPRAHWHWHVCGGGCCVVATGGRSDRGEVGECCWTRPYTTGCRRRRQCISPAGMTSAAHALQGPVSAIVMDHTGRCLTLVWRDTRMIYLFIVTAATSHGRPPTAQLQYIDIYTGFMAVGSDASNRGGDVGEVWGRYALERMLCQ